MSGNTIGDNTEKNPFLPTTETRDKNKMDMPSIPIAIATTNRKELETDEEIVQLLLAPSSSSPKRKKAQIVESNIPNNTRSLKMLPPTASTSPPSSFPKHNFTTPTSVPSPSIIKKKHVPIRAQQEQEDEEESSGATIAIDMENNNGTITSMNNNTLTGDNNDTILSPGSMSFFRTFFNSQTTNTLTLTSMDSKLRQKFSSKFGRIRKRIVYKNGLCNLHTSNISKRKRRYLADIFTTLVDIKWRFTLLIFALSFILSWLLFAMIWWLIAFRHGDLEPDHLPDMQETTGWKPCIYNFYGFTSAYLFSIETQHTIGYGSRFTTEECPDAIFIMSFQSILGVVIQALTVGIVFAKLSRPKKRSQTIVFSRHGVICERDGELCLMFRVGDMRKSHIISASVRAQLIKRKTTAEGEVLPYYQLNLDVAVDNDQTQVFFIWPMIVVHKITKSSPLYNISAAELFNESFEIVLILEGVIETTGATTQARTSYLPSEILWGHRFEPLISFHKEVLQYEINYGLFNHTYEVETPICSAKELDELKNIQSEARKEGNELLTPFRRATSAVSQK